MPFAVWLEDEAQVYWWLRQGGDKPPWDYSLRQAYKELFIGTI
jgi:hypothetical protein